MKMQYSLLPAAIALALAGNVNALPIAQFNEAPGQPQVTLRLSGATAQERGIQFLMRLTTLEGGLCVNGSLDEFTGISNQFLYFCTAAPSIGLPANTRLAVLKSGVGGSGNGVGPVIRRTPSVLQPGDLRSVSGSPDCCQREFRRLQ